MSRMEPLFAWEACADLHNQLLSIGWDSIQEDTGEEPDMASWWAHHFDNVATSSPMATQTGASHQQRQELAIELERRLHPDVVQYLKKVRYGYTNDGRQQNLFYYIGMLTSPESMLQSLKLDETTGVCLFRPENEIVWLYYIPEDEPGGLLLDQSTGRAVILWNNDYFSFGGKDEPIWMTLDGILSAFHEMYDQDRIITVPSDFDPFNFQEPPEWEEAPEVRQPWWINDDDEPIVERTLEAWDELLDAIVSRMPDASTVSYASYEPSAIEECSLRGLFIKKFIERARIPSFAFIAPGLRLAASAELADQPFRDVKALLHAWDTSGYDHEWYPFLFLRTDATCKRARAYDGYPWDRSEQFSCGLYLYNSKSTERADGCRLLLPYALGESGAGFARSGQGKLISKHHAHSGLYQNDWAIVHELSYLRVELLFRNWTQMIAQGHWKVGDNGVEDPLERFKDADTAEKWQDYWIERTW